MSMLYSRQQLAEAPVPVSRPVVRSGPRTRALVRRLAVSLALVGCLYGLLCLGSANTSPETEARLRALHAPYAPLSPIDNGPMRF